MEVCKVVGKKRFAASEKRKAIRWLGARCVTGSEQAVGAVGAVTASEQRHNRGNGGGGRRLSGGVDGHVERVTTRHSAVYDGFDGNVVSTLI